MGYPPVTDAAKMQELLRQQTAIARFGSFALRELDLTNILTEAVRVCARASASLQPGVPIRARARILSSPPAMAGGSGDRSCGVARRYEFSAGARLHHR